MIQRRRFLAGVGGVAAALAGCVTAAAPDGCPSPATYPSEGLRIVNEGEEPVRVTVTVVRELVVSSPTVFERRYDLAGFGGDGAIVTVPVVAETAGPHVISVAVEGGPSGKHFWQVTTDQCDPVEVLIDEEVRFRDVGE
ncbi:MAG: hypothetical protein ABEH77_02415 [Halobacteriaceae archaeon]